MRSNTSDRDLAGHAAAAGVQPAPAAINQRIAEVTQQQRQTQRTLDELRAASPWPASGGRPGVVRALLEKLRDLAAGLDLADPSSARCSTRR